MTEAFYDAEIAPVLLELAQKCEANGMSLIAMCEWAPDESGRTMTLAKDASAAIRLAEGAMQAQGNVDTLFFAIKRYAAKHGHSSIVLTMMDRKAS